MIARIWHAWAKPENVARYRQHFTTSVRPHVEALSGFCGHYVLERIGSGEVEIVVVTLWDSFASIAAFTGPDTRRAVVEDAAAAALSRFDDHVDHYEVGTTSLH